MKSILLISAIFLLAQAHAGTVTPVGKNLGTIPGAEVETRPVKELHALAKEHPTATVLIVVAKSALNENVMDHFKWFYDRAAKKLVCMRRTTMRFLNDDCSWVIWDGIGLDDFPERMPFMSEKFRPKMSKPGNAKESFVMFYPENPAITDWP